MTNGWLQVPAAILLHIVLFGTFSLITGIGISHLLKNPNVLFLPTIVYENIPATEFRSLVLNDCVLSRGRIAHLLLA